MPPQIGTYHLLRKERRAYFPALPVAAGVGPQNPAWAFRPGLRAAAPPPLPSGRAARRAWRALRAFRLRPTARVFSARLRLLRRRNSLRLLTHPLTFAGFLDTTGRLSTVLCAPWERSRRQAAPVLARNPAQLPTKRRP